MLGVGGKPKEGYTIHRHRDSAIVSSVKHRNSHSVHVRPVGSILTPHAALLVHCSGAIAIYSPVTSVSG